MVKCNMKLYAAPFERENMDGVKHEITRQSAGTNEMGWIQNCCSCGWKGKKYYAYDDFQYTLCRQENTAKHIDEATT